MHIDELKYSLSPQTTIFLYLECLSADWRFLPVKVYCAAALECPAVQPTFPGSSGRAVRVGLGGAHCAACTYL